MGITVKNSIAMKNLTSFGTTVAILLVAILLPIQATVIARSTDVTPKLRQGQLIEIADLPAEARDPFELMHSEGFGELKLGLTAVQVLELLGSPETKGTATLWGADGLYHQDWYYPQQGIALNMASETPEAIQTVAMIALTSPSTLQTQLGIGIGDSYTAVVRAYQDWEDRQASIPNRSFVAGSIYGGLIFSFEEGMVERIFLGAAAE
jgi:hypothetical protein